MVGPDGPDQPSVPTQEGAKAVRIIEFSILTCSECRRDCLFVLVEETPSLRRFKFCANCGRYFEEGGEPNVRTHVS